MDLIPTTNARALPLLLLFAACSATPHPPVEHPTATATATAPATAPAIVAAPIPSSDRGEAAAPEVTTELDKTLYTLGMILGRNLDAFSLTPRELALVQRGLADQLLASDRVLVKLDDYGPRVNELKKQRTATTVEAEHEKAAVFLEREAAEPGAQRLPSGVIYRPLKPGSGRSPAATDRVRVQYIGTLSDGREFDSSMRHGPTEFPLTGVIPCWTEGLQKMRVGERAILVCPSAVAYGDAGRPPTIHGGAALRFEIELLGVSDGK